MVRYIHNSEGVIQSLSWPWWFILLSCIHLAAGASFTVIHYFIPDEMMYLLMAKALSMGNLAIENSYAEFPIAVFVFGQATAHDGQLYAQYPSIYAFFALPFYMLGGKTGLIALNQLCFLGIVYVVYRMQEQLFANRLATIFGVVLTIAGGYLWLYSQMIVPHLLQLLLLITAAWLVCRKLFPSAHQHTHKSELWLAGLLIGLGFGIRLDTMFALPLYLLPFLFVKPIRWRDLGRLLPGLLIGIALLSLTNYLKFDTWSPFTYGASEHRRGMIQFSLIYYIIGGLGIAAVATAWVLTRLKQSGRLKHNAVIYLVIVTALFVAFLFLGEWLLSALYSLVLTLLNLSLKAMPEAKLIANEDGLAQEHFIEFKRALFQSCPFIGLFMIPALRKLPLTQQDWLLYAWLMLIPAGFIGFYGITGWHGGFAFNMRYLVPTLPFLAMIAGHIFARLIENYGLATPSNSAKDWAIPILTGAVITGAVVYFINALPMAERNWWLLQGSLFLMFFIPAYAAIGYFNHAGIWLRQCMVMMISISIFWGGATALVHHGSYNAYKRELLELSAYYEPAIPDDALVISIPKLFTAYIGTDDRVFRMATFYNDNRPTSVEEFMQMVDYFTAKQVPIFVTNQLNSYKMLVEFLPEYGYRLKPVLPGKPSKQIPGLEQILPVTDKEAAVKEELS